MSIFGQLDATTVSSNAFHVPAGEYSAEVTKAEYSTVKSGARQGQRQLHIEYTINDELYIDSKVHHYFPLMDADMDEEKFALLPAEEQARFRKSNAKIKLTLCGDDGNSNRPGLGVDPEDLNDPDWDPSSLVGIKVSVAVTNGGDNNEYTNVRWVNKLEE